MEKTDLQLGGGYTYQWECAILLSLNYFFETVELNPTLDSLISGFLGKVTEILLEGESREEKIDLEDINLLGEDRRILIQVKTKQAEGKLWTLSDDLLKKALLRFCNSSFLQEGSDATRFVFLTNRPFHPEFKNLKESIETGQVEDSGEAKKLLENLNNYAIEKKKDPIDAPRFYRMLYQTVFVEYLKVEEVRGFIYNKLQGLGRSDWDLAHAVLFERVTHQSIQQGGGKITPEFLSQVLQTPLEIVHKSILAALFKGLAVTSYDDRIQKFWIEYLGAPGKPVPFGGRQKEIESLDDWLDGVEAPPYALLASPAGSGKSALLAHWAQLVQASGRAEVVFMPISLRFDTSSASVVFNSLAARLASIYGESLSAFNQSPEQWQALYLDYLRRPPPAGSDLLVVLDGLDEAVGWKAGENLLPNKLASGIRIIVSARFQADDVDEIGWLSRLGWSAPGSAQAIPLSKITMEGVKDILDQMRQLITGGQNGIIEEISGNLEVVKQIFRLSTGDPLLVRLYVEALIPKDGQPAMLKTSALENIPPGLNAYLWIWRSEQERRWEYEKRDSSLIVLTDELFNILSMALGPLSRNDLYTLSEERIGQGDSFDHIMTAIDRLIVRINYVKQDGKIEPRYVFRHPKLSEYYQDKMPVNFLREIELREEIEERYLSYGRKVLQRLKRQEGERRRLKSAEAPAYPIQHYGEHLKRARKSPEEFYALICKEWMKAWYALEGMYNGFLSEVEQVWGEADRVFFDNQANIQALVEQMHCALCQSSVGALRDYISPTLLKLAIQHKIITPNQALIRIRTTRNWRRRDKYYAESISAIAPYLPKESNDVFLEILDLLQEINNPEYQFNTIRTLAPYLAIDFREKTREIAQSIADEEYRIRALTLIDHIGEIDLETVPVNSDEDTQVENLANIVSNLANEIGSEDFNKAILEVQQIVDVNARELEFAKIGLEAIEKFRGDDYKQANFLGNIAGYLTDQMKEEALELAREIEDDDARSGALTLLVPHLRNELKEAVIQEALTMTRGYGHVTTLIETLASLTPFLSIELSKETMFLAVRLTEEIKDDYRRGDILKYLFPYLTTDMGVEIYDEILGKVNGLFYEDAIVDVMSALIPHLIDPIKWKALEVLNGIGDDDYRGEILNSLAPYMTGELKRDALTNIIKDIEARKEDLIILDNYLTDDLRYEAIGMAELLNDEADRITALEILDDCLEFGLEENTMNIAKSLETRVCQESAKEIHDLLTPGGPFWDEFQKARIAMQQGDVGAILHIITWFPKMSIGLRNEVMSEALTATMGVQTEENRAQALNALSPYLLLWVRDDRVKAAEAWVYALHKLANYPRSDFMRDLSRIFPFVFAFISEDDQQKMASEILGKIMEIYEWWPLQSKTLSEMQWDIKKWQEHW